MSICTFLYNNPKLLQTYIIKVARSKQGLALKAAKNHLSNLSHDVKYLMDTPVDINTEGVTFEPSSYKIK